MSQCCLATSTKYVSLQSVSDEFYRIADLHSKDKGPTEQFVVAVCRSAGKYTSSQWVCLKITPAEGVSDLTSRP